MVWATRCNSLDVEEKNVDEVMRCMQGALKKLWLCDSVHCQCGCEWKGNPN